MSTTADRILDAAEARMRQGGYHGFSFRDIAADVGVKSASVHHHFATKERLGAAVAQRYADRFLARVRDDAAAGGDIIASFVAGFDRALRHDAAMCLCGVLGAEQAGLPGAVAAGAKGFFDASLTLLTAPDGGGLTRTQALGLLARLEGALLISRAMANPAVFDAAMEADWPSPSVKQA